ncbi:MAG: tyrosine-type recombinase/integrase [Anaerolineae bacterium]|nr:tyrosine-type recombinase/integrase [Anaerolineae bacterium]
MKPQTFDQARQVYTTQAEIRSMHTHEAYLRAVDLFLEFLGDRSFAGCLPIHAHSVPTPAEIPLGALCAADERILAVFAQWLQAPSTDKSMDKRPYSPATVELRLAGVRHWLDFLREKHWLPPQFSLDRALDYLKQEESNPEDKPPQPPKAAQAHQDITALLSYYDHQVPPRRLQADSARLAQWELTRLRNRALVRVLADSGGQISAILSLNTDRVRGDIPSLVLDVMGKNEHRYQIVLQESLPALRDYLQQRRVPEDAPEPLFVSHDARYAGARMSRIIAWRVIQRAARAVGLGTVSPHDLRHYCAQRLIREGASLEDVRRKLGHRSLHTVRTYYGHLLEDQPPTDSPSPPSADPLG